MKKIIALILATLLLAALVIPVLAEEESAADTEAAAVVGVGEADDEDGLDAEKAEGEDAGAEGEVLTTGEVVTTGEEDGESEEEGESPTANMYEGTVISAEGAPDYVVKSDDYYMNYDFGSVFDENGHFKDISALEYVELKNYENLSVPESAIDAKVDEQIKGILESYAAPEHLTEGTVKDGDTLNIDYVGYVDGETFEGGSTDGAGTTVTIGVTSYIEGFLDQVVGHSVGETFDIDVTFPDDYSNEELAGKPATFTVTVNYIEGENVTPELTDEFVAENITAQAEDIKTAQDLIDYFKENEGIKQELIIEQLIASNEVREIPEAAYNFAVDLAIIQYASLATQYGVDLGSLLSVYGISLEEVLADHAEDNLKVAKRMLIVQAIDESRDDISITEDDMKAFATENFGSEDYSEAADTYGIGLLKMYVLQDVVMDHVAEHTAYGVPDNSGFGTKSIIITACVLGGAVLVIALILIIKGATKKKEGIGAADAAVNGADEAGADESEPSGMIDVGELLGVEKTEDAAEEAADAVEDAAEEASEAVEDVAEEAADAVEDAAEEATDAVEDVAEDAVETVEDAAETVEETAEDAVEAAEDAVEETKEE
ncbi:MAG: FKBP-type peptidyl-prolyl cis-trans isomerase [Clostridia bacterium]|nr:FKBP-type peptidyl-prolyl cis-trans isomerase [Clostridia bacterium]